MKQILRQSHLQQCVLLKLLGARQVRSLSELARSLGFYRSSVSRSISAMKDAGLVEYNGRQWVLTADGCRKAHTTKESLPDMIEMARKRLADLIDMVAIVEENERGDHD